MLDVVIDIIYMALRAVFLLLGAVLAWAMKGLRGSLSDELADVHNIRNLLLTILIWGAVFGMAAYLKNR